jgi:nicotinate phosphoribosyltransferase
MRCENLLQPVMRGGVRVDPSPSLDEVRRRASAGVAALPEELRRLRNPEIYSVGLSPKLASEKVRLVRKAPGVLAPGPAAP